MKKINNVLQNRWTSISLLIVLVIFVFAFCAFAASASAETTAVQEALNNKNEELINTQAQLATIASDLNDTEEYVEDVEQRLQEAEEELMLKNAEFDCLTEDVAEIEANMFKSKQVYGVVVTESDVELIAKTVWGEARGLNDFEKSMVVWCILNRVDAGGGTIAKVVKAEGQFHGYHPNFPVDADIANLVRDVIARWQLEKVCAGDVGRTLPADYLWFRAKDRHNVYRNKFDGDYDLWDASDWNQIWNPYE